MPSPTDPSNSLHARDCSPLPICRFSAGPGACRSGFTLIELLVTIAIIAVLAGLLMAGVGGMKAKGQEAKAASDLRQIGAALLAFASENQGLFPISGNTIAYGQVDSATGKPSWQEQVDIYIDGNRRIFGGANPIPLPDGGFRTAYFQGTKAAYVAAQAAGQDPAYAAVQQALIAYPSKYILGGEISNYTFEQDDADVDNYSVEPAFSGPEPRAPSNILFADGHIGKFRAYDPALMMSVYSDVVE